MKNLSIRLKVTLWFSAALAGVVGLTFLVVLSASSSVLQKALRDQLVATVEDNVDEIEFLCSLDGVEMDYDGDQYIAYGDGYLEIDDDYLDQVNGVTTAIYDEAGVLIYGENRIAAKTAAYRFADAQIQRLEDGGTVYDFYDRALTQKGLEGLWLRGVVSEAQGATQFSAIARFSLILLPLLVVAAILGGYWIAGRALAPIRRISQAAARINEGRDLKLRVGLGEGTDELHRLANTFDEMFARLDAAFEAERQFTADASHELRTPVSVILAQCEYSLEKPRSAEEYQEALEVIRRQGGRLSRLVEDMLRFARLECGAERFAFERIDLTALVSSVCEDMARLQTRGMTLDCEAEEGIAINGNRELLSRLLTNLIGNAYRYGRENGRIRVNLRRDDGMLVLSVADDGSGIPPKEREKIFRRFYQGDPARSGQGAGLGLPMAREIARLHGGDVCVESEPGAGSTFICRLPPNSR